MERFIKLKNRSDIGGTGSRVDRNCGNQSKQ
jgi:hypothetical protein